VIRPPIEGPWAIRHVDLSRRPASLAAPSDGRPVYAVFWWRELVLGVRAFAGGELPLNRARLNVITAELGARVLAARTEALGGPALPDADGTPLLAARTAAVAALDAPVARLDALSGWPAFPADALSVIVCTRARPEALAACLASLSVQESPPAEILVVDNAPDQPATRQVVARFPGVRWVPEPRPGLSPARNTGVRAARGRLIAFTDDDVEVRADWTSELARAFDGRDEIEAVTGLVLPASLETLSQRCSRSTSAASAKTPRRCCSTSGSGPTAAPAPFRPGGWGPGPTWPSAARRSSGWACSTSGWGPGPRAVRRTPNSGTGCSLAAGPACTSRARWCSTPTAATGPRWSGRCAPT
jgi:hypothetical protein